MQRYKENFIEDFMAEQTSYNSVSDLHLQSEKTTSPAIVQNGIKKTLEDREDESGYASQIFSWLAEKTSARLGIGHTGTRYRTGAMLAFQADHAAAVDAVTSEVPEAFITQHGLLCLTTRCSSKDMYMTRPDLGKRLSQESTQLVQAQCKKQPDIQIIIGDGLSSAAVMTNAMPVVRQLTVNAQALGLSLGTPVFVKHARVAVLNEIGALTQACVVVHLIGERPGLSTDKSLSAYLSYKPEIGFPESRWTCVSNIHEAGTPPVVAAAMIIQLAEQMRIQKKSGNALKMPAELPTHAGSFRDNEAFQ